MFCVSLVQTPAADDDQTGKKRNEKRRADVVILFFGVLEIKNLYPRVDDRIEKEQAQRGVENFPGDRQGFFVHNAFCITYGQNKKKRKAGTLRWRFYLLKN
jgi:hypothetical protein